MITAIKERKRPDTKNKNNKHYLRPKLNVFKKQLNENFNIASDNDLNKPNDLHFIRKEMDSELLTSRQKIKRAR